MTSVALKVQGSYIDWNLLAPLPVDLQQSDPLFGTSTPAQQIGNCKARPSSLRNEQLITLHTSLLPTPHWKACGCVPDHPIKGMRAPPSFRGALMV